MEDLRSWLALSRTPGLHGGDLGSLLSRFGTAGGILAAGRRHLAQAGLKEIQLDWLSSPDADLMELDLRWLDAEKHSFIAWGTEGYPSLLAEIPDAPVALFV